MKFVFRNLVSLILVLGLCGIAGAARPQWFGGAHDSDWFNIANWMADGSGPVPGSADEVIINNAWNIETPVIFKPNASAWQVKVAEDTLGLAPMTLTVTTGGTLAVTDQVILGYNAASGSLSANDGTLIINGGYTSIANHLFIGFSGKGHLIVNGGQLDIGHQFATGWNGGSGTVELNGGVVHSEEFTFPQDANKCSINIAGGTWIQNHYWVPQIQNLVTRGVIKAYGGNGVVNVTWDPVAQRTIVTAINSLFDLSNITITNNSPIVMDPCTPGAYDLANMFEPGLTQDTKSTIFTDGGTAGAVYFVEFSTNGPAQINTLQLHLEQDATTHDRAITHFTLKAKSAGSSTYDQIVYDTPVTAPYADANNPNVLHLITTLPTAFIGQDFRAEFTGYTAHGPRIREMNASGTLLNPQVHLWKSTNLTQGTCSPAINNAGQFDIRNMFEGGNNTKDTIFVDGSGPGVLYTVEWTTPTPVEILTFQLRASADVGTNARAINHFLLKARTPGSLTYDKVIYNAAITVPYDVNGLSNKVITLAQPVIASQFHAEFTGNDSLGPRITELDAVGYALTNGVSGDLNGSNSVDFKDYSILANKWLVATDQPLQNFDAYTTTSFNAAWSLATNAVTYPTISLVTTNARSGKAIELLYDTVDRIDPCVPCTNTLTYDISGSPITLSQYNQFNFWLKRAATNTASPQFYVQFLAADGTVQASSANVPGTTADAASAYTLIAFNVDGLNMDGIPVANLKSIAKIQFIIAKGQNQTGSTGTLDIDDITLTTRVTGDLNKDGKVDFLDMMLLAENWLAGK